MLATGAMYYVLTTPTAFPSFLLMAVALALALEGSFCSELSETGMDLQAQAVNIVLAYADTHMRPRNVE